MVVAAGAVVVFTWLARRLRREKLTYLFAAFYIVTLAVYAYLLNHVGDGVAWTYYLYGDLYTTLMVTTFFAFLNDSVTPEAAKRLYGLVVLGGVAGGAFGAMVLALWIDDIDRGTWMWICGAAQLVIVALGWVAGRIVVRRGEPPEVAAASGETTKQGNPALEGLRLVLRSRYLFAMVILLTLYDMVSTIVDFQFSATVAHYLSGPAIGQQFANVFTITNVTALALQLFVTTTLMHRFRLSVMLMTTPIAIAIMSLGYLALPLLWTGSLLNTADKAFNYSTNQSSREALYTATSREAKYKAKAFIDMFIHRFAKSLAVVVTLVITSVFVEYAAVRWLTLVTLALVVAWIFVVRYLGKSFRERTNEDGGEPAETPPEAAVGAAPRQSAPAE
jgi:AAA family ATP:ADP antiporter